MCYNVCREEVIYITVNDRLAQLRKEHGLTQAEFGDMFGLSRPAVASIETNRATPRQKLILAVCRKYGINEVWLRTGEGEMYAALSHREEVAVLLGRFLAQKPDTLVHRLTEGLMVYEKPEELEAALSAILDFIKKTFPDALAPEPPAPEKEEEES